MGFSLNFSSFTCLFFLLHPFFLMLSRSSHFVQCRCHQIEGSALWQFKENFIINKNASLNPLAYPKVASWTFKGKSTDCCSWDGVQCDANSGHVIGLDLSSSCLYGSIGSNSTLFSLVQLQSLNLAYNHFNYSPIPSQVRNLSRLTYLNLTASMFSGQIPIEISQLSYLSALHLCHNDDDIGEHFLELNKHNLNKLIGNLSLLQELDLSGVRVNSIIPTILSNLSSLVSLHLADCELHGEFPMGIFRLPNLRVLNVSYNEFLIGYLPEFIWNSRLERLGLRVTSFTGKLPDSIGSLSYLTKLDFYNCRLSRSIPSSIVNLTTLGYLGLSNNFLNGKVPSSLGNLKNLSFLFLSNNTLSGKIPSSLGNLKNLKYLWLSNNNFSGEIPSSFGNLKNLEYLLLASNNFNGEVLYSLGNLKKLKYLGLSNNNFSGNIPSLLGNLTSLIDLELASNTFMGEVPSSIFYLKNLETLDLSSNYFNGTIEFNKFVNLKRLTYLSLSKNQLSVLDSNISANASQPKFRYLGLSLCNIGKFPDFLRNQDKLEGLDLSINNIQGQVPKWMMNISKVSLDNIDLSSNFLTSFAQQSNILPWIHLAFIDLHSNLLQGSLPIPGIFTFQYYVSNNSLTGNIPGMICNLKSLQVLDLSYNNFSGSIPACLNNFGDSLLVLDMQRNKLSGNIPESWVSKSQLTIVNLSQNKFQGCLPRSLAMCMKLKAIDLSSNQLNDIFPSWLENLPNLEVLILRSNEFNGPIKTSKCEFLFPNLRIIDISNNNFIGKLPLELFSSWKFVKSKTTDPLVYIQVYSTFKVFSKSPAYLSPHRYSYSMTITIKGQNRFYEKVLELFAAIDMSSNRFSGEIPEGIKSLKGCHSLNLSYNMLSGHIPLALVYLVELEALDLSQNEFFGKIPYELIQLTFLEFFNVSYNNLKGPIPQGKQFDTFDSSSFEGNQELCGRPLSKNCGNLVALPPPSLLSKENEEFESLSDSVWEIVTIGYAIGLVFGVMIGNIVITQQHDWLLRTFGRKLI